MTSLFAFLLRVHRAFAVVPALFWLGVTPATDPVPVRPSRDVITIDRAPPTVQRTTFTPSHPPPEMRKMKSGEAAFTQYDFNCAVNVKYEVIEQSHKGDGSVDVVARIRAVRVRLTLENRIYIPDNANIPLRSHEEGHREINEHTYDTSEPVARELAEQIMTKTWPGSGTDVDAAGKHATDAAVKELCDAYLDRIAGRASRVGDFYDQITANGGRPVRITTAIQEAFTRDLDRADASKSTTQAASPASTPLETRH